VIALGKTLQIPGAAASTEDAQYGHQEQQPRRLWPSGRAFKKAIRSAEATERAKVREQPRQNQHQHGCTSCLVPDFQSALLRALSWLRVVLWIRVFKILMVQLWLLSQGEFDVVSYVRAMLINELVAIPLVCTGLGSSRPSIPR
jgi:hypothetical protein